MGLADSDGDGSQAAEHVRSSLGFKVLIFLATVIASVSMFAVWANRQVLDADNWSRTSSELLANDAIRKATSVYVTDQIYRNIDVEGELRKAFPDQAQLLAGPAATGLRGLAEDAINQALGTPLVQGVWQAANRLAAEQFLNVVNERGVGAVQFKGNDVQLDLRPAALNLAGKIGLQSQADRIPAGAATFTVFESKQIGQIRAVARFLSGVAVIFPLLALALYVLAVGVSRGRRRKAVITVGWSLIVAAGLSLVVRDVAKGPFVDALARTDAVRAAVTATYGISTSMLSSVAGNTIVLALLLILAATLGGPLAPARAFRRSVAPWLNGNPGLGYAVAYALLFLMVLVEPIPAVRSWLMLPVFAALTGIGVWALERELAIEFPDARREGQVDALRDLWDRLTGHVNEGVARGSAAARQAAGQVRDRIGTGEPQSPREPFPQAASQPGAAPPRPPEAPLDGAHLELLERLGGLRSSGVISEAEFEAEKARILGSR